MKHISTDKAAKTLDDYAQAVIHDSLVYVSMQLPIDADNDMSGLKCLEEQTELILKNIKHILEHSGSDLNHVLRLTVYLKDIHHIKRINSICNLYFETAKPTRTILAVSSLPLGFSIAMDAVAACKNQSFAPNAAI